MFSIFETGVPGTDDAELSGFALVVLDPGGGRETREALK